MKRKRERQAKPELSPANGELLVSMYHAFEEGLERCARLTERREAGASAAELRPQALQTARWIAYVSRVMWEAILWLKLLESIPESRSPVEALKVLARLGYALIALAEEDPEPEALLSPAEIDRLIAKHGIEDWLSFHRRIFASAKKTNA
jgi:hypothetical protein